MHVINNVFKWSLYASAVTAFILVGGIVFMFLMIEVLAYLMGVVS